MLRLSPVLRSHAVQPRHDDRRDQIQNQSAAAQQCEQRPAQPDPGGVPAEILGDTGAHTGDHPVLGITVQLLIHINLLYFELSAKSLYASSVETGIVLPFSTESFIENFKASNIAFSKLCSAYFLIFFTSL